MKTYKINNVEVSADEIRKIMRDNPDLLKEAGSVPLVPDLGEVFWRKDPEETAGYTCENFNNTIIRHSKILKNTEVYRTEEEVKRAVEVDRAILRVRCWIRDNIEGGVWDKPDWSEYNYKYFIQFDHEDTLFEIDCWRKKQTMSPIGYFRTDEGGNACISACEADLKIIFGIE